MEADPKPAPPVIHPDVETLLARSEPYDTITVHVKLRPLDQPGEVPVEITPESRQQRDPAAQKRAAADYKRVQKMRYGQTLTLLRAHVSTNLRGPDDLPLADYVVAWGYREAIRAVAQLAGVAEIVLPPAAPRAA